jgi:hypothetical protein
MTTKLKEKGKIKGDKGKNPFLLERILKPSRNQTRELLTEFDSHPGTGFSLPLLMQVSCNVLSIAETFNDVRKSGEDMYT